MKNFKTFTSLSVNDLAKAKSFYIEKLGLDKVSMEDQGVLMIETAGDTKFMIYRKENHEPADFTVLNFEVDNLVSVLNKLKNRGVNIEKTDETDNEGIAEMGPVKAAWIRDPSGNWIALFQNVS